MRLWIDVYPQYPAVGPDVEHDVEKSAPLVLVLDLRGEEELARFGIARQSATATGPGTSAGTHPGTGAAALATTRATAASWPESLLALTEALTQGQHGDKQGIGIGHRRSVRLGNHLFLNRFLFLGFGVGRRNLPWRFDWRPVLGWCLRRLGWGRGRERYVANLSVPAASTAPTTTGKQTGPTSGGDDQRLAAENEEEDQRQVKAE
jgi:hypothetical protein